MRLLLVTHYFSDHRSGIEIVARETAARLAGEGVRITWAASAPTDREPLPGIEYLPMEAWNLTERALDVPFPFWGLGSMRKLVAAVKRSDVLHLHHSIYPGQIVAYVVARLHGIPVVITQHVDLVPYPNRLLRFLHWLANRTVVHATMAGAGAVTFVSEKVERYFHRFIDLEGRAQLIPNGIDPRFRPATDGDRRAIRAKLGLAPERKVVLFVGRFTVKKGLSLLEGAARLMPEHDWLFIGWGKLDPRSWGLPHVRCLESMSHEELVPYYQAADVLVLPSVGEGFPLVVQEAMACGTPAVISTDTARAVSGIEAHVQVAESNGESVRAAISRVLEPEGYAELRRSTATYARARWQGWDAISARYRALFESVVWSRERVLPRSFPRGAAENGGVGQ